MKILLGAPEYPPHHIGGGGEVFQNLVKGYKKEGHELVVIYGYYKSGWFDKIKEYKDTGITFYQVPEIPYPKHFSFLKTIMPIGILNSFRLKKIIKNEKVDTAHIHGYGHLFIDTLARHCYNGGIEYVFTNHGFPKIPFQKGLLIKIIWTTYMKFYGNFINKHAKNITCVSKYTQSEYGTSSKKVSVVPNGIYPPKWFDSSQKHDLRKSFPTNKKILLSVGRITKYKGFQDVISEMSNIPEFIYIIIGREQDYQNNLQDLANKHNVSDRIFFLGNINRNLLDLYYQIADYVIIPSHVESFGLIGLEALVNRKIVIHSGIQGLLYLNGSRNAYNYSQDKQRIASLLKQELKFQQEDFCEEFSWEKITNKYLSLMK